MSIIKDNVNGSKRIVRFANGLIPKTNASGNLISGGSGRYARTYADMGTDSSAWFPIDGGASDSDSILIRVSIPQNSAGYFFGCYKSGGAGVWLRKSGDKVYFKCGGSTSAEVSVDWKEGFHVYGFIHSENGTRLLYDKRCVNQSSYTNPLTSSDLYYVGRCNGKTTSGDSPANVLIAKVLAMTDRIYHYYPTSTLATGVTPCGWYETREHQDVIKSGVGTTSGVAAPYGVDIEDLREITGSGYGDLMAIMAGDAGVATELGWTAESGHPNSAASPYVAKNNNFAFSLYNVHIIDIYGGPGGTTGDLVLGRKPKWNMWNDTVPRGLWVREYGSRDSEMNCNLFMTFMKKQSSLSISPIIHLEDYEGYSTAAGHVSRPQFKSEVPSQILYGICNGTIVKAENKNDPVSWPSTTSYLRCSPLTHMETRLMRSRLWPRLYNDDGPDGSRSASYRSSVPRQDDTEVIYVNDGHEFDLDPITVAMGNIIDWADSGAEKYDRARFYGVGLVMYDASRGTGYDISRSYEYMMGHVNEQTYLGAATSAAVKTAYKDAGKSVSLSFLPGKANELARYLTDSQHTSKECLIEMGLVLKPGFGPDDELTHTRRLLAPKPISLKRDGDVVTDYRCVLMTPTVEISNGTITRQCNVIFGQVDYSTGGTVGGTPMKTRYARTGTNGVDFMFPFFLHYDDNETGVYASKANDYLVHSDTTTGVSTPADHDFRSGFGTGSKVVVCIQVSYLSNGVMQEPRRYKATCKCCSIPGSRGGLANNFNTRSIYGDHSNVSINDNSDHHQSSDNWHVWNYGTCLGDICLYQEWTDSYVSAGDYKWWDVAIRDVAGLPGSGSSDWEELFQYYFIGHMFMDGTAQDPAHAVIPENSTVQVWLYQDNRVPSEWDDAIDMD